MSIKSTHVVTREFAIAAIQMKLFSMDDQTLASVLEDAIHDGFMNFRIVSQEELERVKEEEYGRYLDDLGNLPEYNHAY